MTTQNSKPLTEDEKFEIIDTFETLTKKERKLFMEILKRMSKVSRENRSRKNFMEANGFYDRASA